VPPKRPQPRRPPTRLSAPREAALLAQSRRDLSQGNSLAALDGLDRYTREFPHGELPPDALLLLVEALRTRGEHTRASAVAGQFVAKNPQSPYAASMRRLLNEPRPR